MQFWPYVVSTVVTTGHKKTQMALTIYTVFTLINNGNKPNHWWLSSFALPQKVAGCSHLPACPGTANKDLLPNFHPCPPIAELVCQLTSISYLQHTLSCGMIISRLGWKALTGQIFTLSPWTMTDWRCCLVQTSLVLTQFPMLPSLLQSISR